MSRDRPRTTNSYATVLKLSVVMTVISAPSPGAGQQCSHGVYMDYSPGVGCYIPGANAVCCSAVPRLCGGDRSVSAGENECSPEKHPDGWCQPGTDVWVVTAMCTGGPTEATQCVPRPVECAGDEADCNGIQGDSCAPPDGRGGGGSGVGAGGAPPPPGGGPPPPPPPPDGCKKDGIAGADPIMLTVNAVATEPYTDFSVARLTELSLTRTYSSADADYAHLSGGGVFGVGWHHNWEANLKCSLVPEGGAQRRVCSITRGLAPGYKFAFEGTHTSLDGLESWDVYTPYAPVGYAPAHRNLLVARPDGEWIAYLTDGSELHFRSVCTSCDAGMAWCLPLYGGGSARLIAVIDGRGNRTSLSYDPAALVPLSLADDLGHVLEVRSSSTCSRYATELRYDGAVVARYDIRGDMLLTVTDAEGQALRSYAYPVPGPTYQRMSVVRNEAGTAIAEFSYDAQQRAVGLVDRSSNLSVAYDNMSAQVTEHFRGPSGDTAVTSTRTWDWNRRITSITEGCACGSARQMTWTPGGKISCRLADGVVTSHEFDAIGRIVRALERPGADCNAPAAGTGIRDTTYAYAQVKPIAAGVELPLDTVTGVTRPSTVTGGPVGEAYDFDRAAKSYDPSGYSCTPNGGPPGSVMCRSIRSGYVQVSGAIVLQRYATFYSYDARGRVVRTYGPVSLDAPGPDDVPPIEERTYWADGDSPARQGRLREVKVYARSAAQPLVTSYDYDIFGTYRVTRPDGSMTTFIKDGRGRTTFAVEADANAVVRATTETRYYDGLLPRLRVFPTGRVERYTYDAKGRLLRTELMSGDPEAPGANPTIAWVESHQYDASGNQIHTERADGQGNVTWQQDKAYDVQHRVVSVSTPGVGGSPKTFSYVGGFLGGMTDEAGRATQFTPDPLNRVAAVTQSGRDRAGNPVSAAVASYAFASYADHLAAVTDGSTRTTSYATDDFGRVAKVDSPTQGVGRGRWYQYDARGNLVAWGDAGTTATLAYDGLDRLLAMDAQSATDGSTVHHEYRYDERGFPGKLTSRVEPGRTVTFTYDYGGRVQAESSLEPGVAASLTTTYVYDAEGAVREVTYPSGLVVAYDRDPATGAVSAVRDVRAGTVIAGDVETLPFGPVAWFTYGNGKSFARTFDARYEPVAIESGPVRLTYSPSPEGGFESLRDRSEEPTGCVRDDTWTVTRDLRNRLKAWSVTTAAGAGVCPAASGPPAARWTYVSGTDLVASASDGRGTTTHTFGYDARGNVTAVAQLDATGTAVAASVCLRHDALGRMVAAGPSTTAFAAGRTACTTDAWLSSVSATYRYDALNRRVGRSAGGISTTFAFDGQGHGLSELTQSGGRWGPVRDYVWLGDLPVAQVEYVASAARTYFVHADHLGTPKAMTTPSGQAVWTVRGEPYGEVAEQTAADPATGRPVVTNLRLPGQYDERLLAAAGISGMQGPYYNWNRWYLPSIGRYLELDPLALRGVFNGEFQPDWYNYASGNPLSWVDPFGLTDRYTLCVDHCKDLKGSLHDECVKRCKKTVVDSACRGKWTHACCEADYNGCMQEIEPGSDGSEKKMTECQNKRQECHDKVNCP